MVLSINILYVLEIMYTIYASLFYVILTHILQIYLNGTGAQCMWSNSEGDEYTNTEMDMLSFGGNFHHWLHWKFAASDRNFVKMMTFPFPWITWIYLDLFSSKQSIAKLCVNFMGHIIPWMYHMAIWVHLCKECLRRLFWNKQEACRPIQPAPHSNYSVLQQMPTRGC